MLDVVGAHIKFGGETYINDFFAVLQMIHETTLEKDTNLMNQFLKFIELMNKFSELDSNKLKFSEFIANEDLCLFFACFLNERFT